MTPDLSHQGSLRKLWPTEREAFCDHLLRLDAESRRSRFGMGVSDEFLRDYTARCFGMADVVYGYFNAGVLRGTAELRPLLDSTPDHAEVAFSVEPEFRHCGVGSELFSRLITAARNRGYLTLHMSCLASNRAMQALAHKFRAELEFDYDETLGRITADTRSPASFAREAVDDFHGFATAVLDLQSRRLSRWKRLMKPANPISTT
jgi:GNAT superfamily N-acetyltransferase